MDKKELEALDFNGLTQALDAGKITEEQFDEGMEAIRVKVKKRNAEESKVFLGNQLKRGQATMTGQVKQKEARAALAKKLDVSVKELQAAFG